MIALLIYVKGYQGDQVFSLFYMASVNIIYTKMNVLASKIVSFLILRVFKQSLNGHVVRRE